MDYWDNIEGCLERYRDVKSVGTWIARAQRSISTDAFSGLLEQLICWQVDHLEQSPETVDGVVGILNQTDPAAADSLRERLARRTDEIQKEIGARAEEAAAKEARRLADVAKRQKQEFERERRLAVKQEALRRKDEALQSLRNALQTDFLTAEARILGSGWDGLSPDEIEQEVIAHVVDWAKNAFPGRRTPDTTQARAIAANSGKVLVTARAGSGKTSTIVWKALFLIGHCGVAAEDILIVAFNKNAVVEVAKKLAETQLGELPLGMKKAIQDHDLRELRRLSHHRQCALPPVMTFHALAHGLVSPLEEIVFDREGAEKQSEIIQSITDLLRSDPRWMDRIKTVMLAHYRCDWEGLMERHYHLDRDEFLQLRRSLQTESLKGDYVKSYGEKLIADCLFENDIEYDYEKARRWGGRAYRPDFTIGSGNRVIAIEYFGMVGNAGYDEQVRVKRDYWRSSPGGQLIEIYPDDVASRSREEFFDYLSSVLRKHGLAPRRLSEDEIWMRAGERAVSRFSRAMRQFISKCRKLGLDLNSLKRRVQKHSCISDAEKGFLDIGVAVYGFYLEDLSNSNRDDFDGLMLRASESLARGKASLDRADTGMTDLRSVKYLFIDEFQDFSLQFDRIVSAVQRINPTVSLFCVGDDWQAINGFAGSDLSYFRGFSARHADSRHLAMPSNYRSGSVIVDVGNRVMQGMGIPAQAFSGTGRILIADIGHFVPLELERIRPGFAPIVAALARIIFNESGSQDGQKATSLAILSRQNDSPGGSSYGCSYPLIGKDSLEASIKALLPKGWDGTVRFSTVHKFKGNESDVVVILDAVASRFPMIHPDWVWGRVFGDDLPDIIEEEKRLFYVAVTRPREKLIIITDGTDESPFLGSLRQVHDVERLDWANYAPPPSSEDMIVVSVRSQPGLGSSPTFKLRTFLKSAGYKWRRERESWVMVMSRSDFDENELRRADWVGHADGALVQVTNSAEQVIAEFAIDKGNWRKIQAHSRSGRLNW